MSQAYGVQIYHSWNSVKYMLLKHIQQHLTTLETTSAIFAREDCQKDSGILCHNYLINAIKKDTMNYNTENYIQYLIRTSIVEVVRTDDDLERLLIMVF